MKTKEKTAPRRRNCLRLAIFVLFLLGIYFCFGIFVVQPIGAVPEGVTVVYLRLGTNMSFISSADGILLKNDQGVSLLTRGIVLAKVGEFVADRKIVSLPYSRTLYLISTGGRELEWPSSHRGSGTSSKSSVSTGQGKPIKTESIAISRSAEEEIRDFAKKEYPNDSSMQQYVYKNQISAHRYMSNVADSEVKEIATREYPYDYSMQKYTYDNQFSAKRYMTAIPTSSAKSKAQREYPNDYSMQKYTYDRIVSR